MQKCELQSNFIELHFGVGVLLEICSIFSEHLLLYTYLWWSELIELNIEPNLTTAHSIYLLTTSQTQNF